MSLADVVLVRCLRMETRVRGSILHRRVIVATWLSHSKIRVKCETRIPDRVNNRIVSITNSY